MKKVSVFVLLIMCGIMTAFGQLKVVNDSGQDLNITVNGKKFLVPYKGTQIFDARGKTVWLECATIDGKVKFAFSKQVSRAGIVRVLAEDSISIKGTTLSLELKPVTPVDSIPKKTSIGLTEILKNGSPTK